MLQTLLHNETLVGCLLTVATLPLVVAAGCLWIWILAKMNSRLLPGMRTMCVIAFTMFPLFALIMSIIRFLLWKAHILEVNDEPSVVGEIIVLPLWVFVVSYSLYRFSARLQRSKEA